VGEVTRAESALSKNGDSSIKEKPTPFMRQVRRKDELQQGGDTSITARPPRRRSLKKKSGAGHPFSKAPAAS